MRAIAAILLAAGAAQARGTDWFHAVQYAPAAVELKGCARCAGEADDVCALPAGAQVRALDAYAAGRWPSRERIRLLRSKSEPECAVPVSALESGPVELAAIRMSSGPPPQQLVQRAQLAVRGWPVAPHKREGRQLVRAEPRANELRAAVVCWPAAEGWPVSASGRDAPRSLGAANACEYWLLATTANGEPDVGGPSFPLLTDEKDRPRIFPYGDPALAAAFDANRSIEEPLLTDQRAAAPARVVAKSGPCGQDAAGKSATLDRFDQWDAQVRRVRGRPSLDRGALTLDAAAWAGHCQELDVLRTALESQLGCTLRLQGRCAGAGGPR